MIGFRCYRGKQDSSCKKLTQWSSAPVQDHSECTLCNLETPVKTENSTKKRLFSEHADDENGLAASLFEGIEQLNPHFMYFCGSAWWVPTCNFKKLQR